MALRRRWPPSRWREGCPGSSELTPSCTRTPPGGPCSRTVEGDVGEPLEQGDASAQLLCLTAGPLQLRSVASGDRGQARPSGSWQGWAQGGWRGLWGAPPGSALHPCSGLTPPPAAPWRRLARSEHCPGPHLPHPLPWRPARDPEVRKPGCRWGGGPRSTGRRDGGEHRRGGREFRYLLLTLARQFPES